MIELFWPNRLSVKARTEPNQTEPMEIDGQLRLPIPGFSADTDSTIDVLLTSSSLIIIIIIYIRSIIIIDFTDSAFSR